MTDRAGLFQEHRSRLRGVAYRMLGSMAEAEDVLQDAYVRFQAASETTIEVPAAYLTRLVTRLSLDVLKSARVRREKYVGPWLPEPILEPGLLNVEPESQELSDDVSVALLLALERLSPLERAAFLLHDVFDLDYSEVARSLERTEVAVRQLAARARKHVRENRPRFAPSGPESARLIGAFGAAAASGDTAALESLLAQDAVFYGDGGGRVRSATLPVRGRRNVAKFVVGVQRKTPMDPSTRIDPATLNGLPGVVIEQAGQIVQTIAFEIRDGLVAVIYAVRNPEKLAHLARG